jgi:hypothetical protein
MSIEIFPFDYVFRAGSRIRLIIDAPVGETGGWSLQYLKTPATNTVWHDPEHPSRLVLGLLPGAHAWKPEPLCDTLLNQPCRTNTLPLPSGSLDLQTTARPGCPLATGRLSGTRLGLVRLGMTRARAQRVFSRSSSRGKRYLEFFCLTPHGVRVGYASPRLLKKLPPRERQKVRGRVVWASTSNRFYSVHGVRPGTSLHTAARRLRLGRGLHIGLNWWYFAPNGAATAVLKVRHGIVEEIGIAIRSLTQGSGHQRRLMTSFF